MTSPTSSLARPGGRLRALLALLTAVALLAAACSGSSDEETVTAAGADSATGDGSATGDSSATGDTEAEDGADPASDQDTEDSSDAAVAEAFPRTVVTPSGDVTIEARPERIVSLSATATEMLFAIGAGDQVEAVDSFSNYPPEAPTTDLAAFEANLEAVAIHDPDLVVLGFPNEELEAGLAQVGVPVLVLLAAATLNDTYEQVAILGEATDNIDGAAAANASIRHGIDEVLARLPETDQPVRVYHELDDTFYSASSATSATTSTAGPTTRSAARS